MQEPQPLSKPVRVDPLRADEFRQWLWWEIQHGRIPTPTACALFLGRKVERTAHARGGPTISGIWSSARIDVFTRAGLVKVKGRWRFPKEDA